MLVSAIASGYPEKIITFLGLLGAGSGLGWVFSTKASNSKTKAETSVATEEALKTRAETQDISSVTTERLLKLSDDRMERIDKDNQLLREQFNLLHAEVQGLRAELQAKKIDAALDKERIAALEGHVIVLENVVRSLGGEIPPRPQQLLKAVSPPYA